MRPLPLPFEDKLKLGIRSPAYKLYAYDTKVDSLSAIVLGTNTLPPLDLTEMVDGDLSWSPAQLSFTLADKDGSFHGDSGSWRRYIEDGCCIRLKEGDSRVDEYNWVWTFTGTIKGQAGWVSGPRGSMVTCKITAYNRDSTQAYKRRKITTREYTDGTDIGIMMHDIANVFMGITDAEFLIPRNTGRVFMHKINQLCLVAPWDGICSVAEVDRRVPFFNGDGKLTWWSKDLARNPVRVLPDYIKVFKLEMPAMSGDVINKVKVTFLDSVMDKVPGSDQCLGKADITTGFFTFEEKLVCWWSDDRKLRAENTRCVVIKGINDQGLGLPIGRDPGTDPSLYQELSEYNGEITIEISAWVPTLLTMLGVTYLILAAMPDGVSGKSSVPEPRTNLHTHLAAGFIVDQTGPPMLDFHSHLLVPATGLGSYTFPEWGKIAQTICGIGIMLVMMSFGSAQYEVWGTPYDMAYVQKRSIAVENGLDYWNEIEKAIQNDFIGSFDQADAVALTELIFEKSTGNPRALTIDDDLTLEVGDIVQIPDGRQVFIQDMKKTIKRGVVNKLEIIGFKILVAPE